MNLLLRYPTLLRLMLLLFITGQLTAQAQQTLTLSDRDASGIIFDGNVFQAGTQFGNASIYAKFGGNGPTSFQIDSPGENLTKTVTADGFFDIIPSGSTVIDKSKIKNFSGTITGSVTVTVRSLSITTSGIDVSTNVAPGSVMSVSYITGPGTFPIDLSINGFKVQLLDANGILLKDLLNSTDQLTPREQKGVSKGDTRMIKATLPGDLAGGTYRVRVVTQGLIQNVLGSASSSFTVRAAVATTTISTGSVGSAVYCVGTTVSVPFSTSGTFPAGNTFNVQIANATGATFQDLAGTSTSSPVLATLPATLPSGSYLIRVVSTNPVTVGTSSPISLAALPTLTLSGSPTSVAGTPATVQLTFTGTPPWSLTYTDNSPDFAPTFTRSATFSTSPAVISPTLYSSVAYAGSFIKNFRDAGCGLSNQINGSAAVTITPLTITTGAFPQGYCPDLPVSVSFTTTGRLPADAICQVQLSDINGSFQTPSTIGTGGQTSPIVVIPGKNLIAGAGYKIRVVLQNYSNIVSPVPASLVLTRPPLPGVTDVFYCPGTAPSQLTAIGTNLQWYVTSDSIVLQGPPTPPANQSSRYLVRQTVNGCASSLATINVTQGSPPSAPAVSNIALCQGSSGQFTSPIAGALWYTAATGGTGTAQPAVSSQTAGEQTLYVSQTISGCESARAAVKITVNPIPASPVVQTPPPVCQYTSGSALSATGVNLVWYDQSGKIAGAPVPNAITAGTKSYSVTQTIAGCESLPSVINQVVRAAPANPTADPVRYCVGDRPISLTATGSNLKWYTTPTGGTSSATSPSFVTTIATTFTYYVTQTDNAGCESTRQPVLVSVVSAPAAPTVVPNQIVCQFAQVGPLSASPNGGLVWQGSGITGSSDVAPTPVTSQPGTFTYSVVQKAGSCVSPASLVTFVVLKSPDAPSAPSPVNFCIGQAGLPLSAISTGNALTWYLNADRSGPALSQVTPPTAQAGTTTYYVTQYILQSDGKKCESPNTAVVVSVQAQPTATLVGDGEINLGDSTAIRVRFTGNGPWKFTRWDSVQVETKDSLYIKWETPKPKPVPDSPYSYTIQNLTGACGIGIIQNSLTLIVRKPLSVQPATELMLLTVYPNPTLDVVDVNWNAPSGQTADLQLISLEGKLIRQVSRPATGFTQTETFRITGHPAGTYYLRLITPENGILTRKIIKQ